jgi:hypothetical protein
MLKYSNCYFRWGDVTLSTACDDARYLQLNERQTSSGLVLGESKTGRQALLKLMGRSMEYISYILIGFLSPSVWYTLAITSWTSDRCSPVLAFVIVSSVTSTCMLKSFLTVALHESGTRNDLLGPWLNNTEVYLTPFTCFISPLGPFLWNWVK